MKNLDLRLLLTGTLISLSFIFGLLLSSYNRPLNTALFAFHKISAVGGLAMIAFTIFTFYKISGLSRMEFVITAVIGLFVIMTLATGILLSFDKFADDNLILLHKIASSFTLILSLLIVILFKFLGMSGN